MAKRDESLYILKRSWPRSNHKTKYNWLEYAQQHEENSSPKESTSKILKLSDPDISDSSPECELKPNVPEIAEVVETFEEQSDSDDENKDFAHKLASWARKFKINAKALDELLVILGRSEIWPLDFTAEDLLGGGEDECEVNGITNGNSSKIHVEICEELQVDSARTQDKSDRTQEESKNHGAQLQLHQNGAPSTMFERKLDMKVDLILENQRLMMATITRLLPLDDLEDRDFPSPLREVHELETLSEKLKQDPVLGKKMIRRLGSIGGRDVPDCVRNIMKSIGKDELWCKYSYKGKSRKGKRPLQALYISKIIIRACMRCNANSKIKDIEVAMADKLRYAPRRASIGLSERRVAMKLELSD